MIMRRNPVLYAIGLCLLLLSSHVTSAQVSARVTIGGGGYYPPRPYYGTRYYPGPAVVLATPVYIAPPPVVVYRAPYYARPYYARPRYYGFRGQRW